MSRKSLWISIFILLVLLTALGTSGWYSLKHEPAFYLQADTHRLPDRRKESRQFEQTFNRFIADVRFERQWQAQWTDQQINCWLVEDFINSNMHQWLPEGIRDPRVQLRGNEICLGLRYGSGEWSAVVSLTLKVWLAPREPNVIMVEVQQFRIGSIPLTIKLLQDEVSQRVKDQSIKVHWYRHEGNPVAVVRLQADKREPTYLLQTLQITQGMIHIQGKSLDPELRGPPKVPNPTSSSTTTASSK